MEQKQKKLLCDNCKTLLTLEVIESRLYTVSEDGKTISTNLTFADRPVNCHKILYCHNCGKQYEYEVTKSFEGLDMLVRK
jgi:transcription elongation factor Elf1